MGNERKYTIFEIVNIVFFLLTLVALACKFGLFFKEETRIKFFNIYYYFFTTSMFALSFIISIVNIIKSKKLRNSYEIADCSKDVISTINISVVSFEAFASLFGTISVEKVAFEWLQLIIYLSIIMVCINTLVYYFVREKIVNDFRYYNQRDIINGYIIYAIVISFVFGIIIPNFMLHFGIMKAIRMG